MLTSSALSETPLLRVRAFRWGGGARQRVNLGTSLCLQTQRQHCWGSPNDLFLKIGRVIDLKRAARMGPRMMVGKLPTLLPLPSP